MQYPAKDHTEKVKWHGHVMKREDEHMVQKKSFQEEFNKIATQARAQMAADKEAVGLSRFHMYESKCILP